MFGLLYATEKGGYGPLQAYNIMFLHSPKSAILSAVIFNALIIVALIPLALRGVKYQPLGAKVILRKNMLIYGIGGILVPFLFIQAHRPAARGAPPGTLTSCSGALERKHP